MENKSIYDLISCPHCSGKGTCFADNGNSCATCLKEAKVKRDAKIVICSVCGGKGITEMMSARMMNRVPVIIVTIVLFVFYFYTCFNLFLFSNSNFSEIFPVIGSLTTMIVAFYFAQRK